MLRNVVIAALRNLLRNRLYTGITLTGLAVAFAAALLITLYVRDELSYDRWIPGYRDVYRLDSIPMIPGQAAPPLRGFSLTSAAPFLKLDYPEVQNIGRITLSLGALRAGAIEGIDGVMWADRDFFAVLPMPAIAGDLRSALATPDALVLTRRMARKYFGRDAPLGAYIEVNPGMGSLPGLSPEQKQALGTFHTMHVAAVIEDLPANSHLKVEIFAAGAATYSPMKHWDEVPSSAEVYAYVRLRPGAAADNIRRDLAAFVSRHYPRTADRATGWRFELTSLAAVHLVPATPIAVRPSGDRTVIAAVSAVGLLIVVIASINFVTLMTARAARRTVEVGVRKTAGASRGSVALQFIGEAMIYVALSMLLALALTEIALPAVNAFLQRSLRLDYLHDPVLAAGAAGTALIVGVLAGLYPALLLSALRPVMALKGTGLGIVHPNRVRRVLVLIQFAILVSLIIATATIYRQARFTLHNSLAVSTPQVISVFTPCRDSFKQQVLALPGVSAAACTSSMAMGTRPNPTTVSLPDGSLRTMLGAAIDPGFLEMHGLQPIAGRFLSSAYGSDMVLAQDSASADVQPSIVINRSAVARLGLTSPEAAIGKAVPWGRYDPSLLTGSRMLPLRASEIVGVVEDFTLTSVQRAIEPTMYYVDPKAMLYTVVRLNGRQVTDTLTAIDSMVKRSSPGNPVQRTFEDDPIRNLYADVMKQAAGIAVCAALAIFIAGLGLFGLAAFDAEQRTKEIGIRKVMGATRSDIVRLLLWQFSQPVLWANLLAWPLAAWAMTRWLNGFAYHVNLPVWLFAASTLLALAVGMATVSTHCILVARAPPAGALRYE